MGSVLLSLYFLLLKWFVIIIKAEEANITFPFILNATNMKNFNKTSILRYGFHKTHKCLDFQKTYVCINTCLTRGYDIASADKDCKCTCFKDKLKSKYFGVNSDWKIPTTTVPAWGKGYLDPSKEKFVNVHTHKNELLKQKTNETNEPAQYEISSDEETQSDDTEYADPEGETLPTKGVTGTTPGETTTTTGEITTTAGETATTTGETSTSSGENTTSTGETVTTTGENTTATGETPLTTGEPENTPDVNRSTE